VTNEQEEEESNSSLSSDNDEEDPMDFPFAETDEAETMKAMILNERIKEQSMRYVEIESDVRDSNPDMRVGGSVSNNVNAGGVAT